MLDFRESTFYRDPEREYKKLNAIPEDYQLRLDPLGRNV